jgi:hypothetical protein
MYRRYAIASNPICRAACGDVPIGSGEVTQEDKVLNCLIGNRGSWFCDQCLEKQFGMSHPHERTIAATLGAQGQTGSKNTEVSRIQFSVPLKLTKGQSVPGKRASFAEMD